MPDEFRDGLCFADQYRAFMLYLDTPRCDVYHRGGSFGRAKYRVRPYEGNHRCLSIADSAVSHGCLRVQRSCHGPSARKSRAGEVAANVQWFGRPLTVRSVRPVCMITYDRTARETTRNGEVARFMLDHSVRAIANAALDFQASSGPMVSPWS